MFIVIVHVHVKEKYISAFMEASTENASNSFKEEGVNTFDVIQENGDPAKFVLLEVYRDESAAKAHKDTAHYKKWKETVEEMITEPRLREEYHEIYPSEKYWQKK